MTIPHLVIEKSLYFLNPKLYRGHLLKIQKPSCRKTLRINSFPTRCINLWNSLSEEIVDQAIQC